MNNTKLFGYIRISDKYKQSDGASLEAQKELITNYARKKGLEIVKFYEDRQTAAKVNRRNFNIMLNAIREDKADGFIGHKIDRIMRNFHDWGAVHELGDIGKSVHSVMDDIDISDNRNKLSADINAVVAINFIRNLRSETKKGQQGRLRAGIYPFMAPLGYINTGAGQLKTLDPIRAPLIKKAFELYAHEGYALRLLTKKMYELGLRNRNGNKVARNSLNRLLKNSFYTGIIDVKGKIFQGKHEPLISSHLFQRVQDTMSGKINMKTKRHKLIFRKKITCELCTRTLIGEKQKGHVYYRCHTPDCKTTSIREDLVESYLKEILKNLQLNEKEGNHFDTLANTTNKDWLKRQQELIQSIQLQLGHLVAKKEKLMNFLLEDRIPQDQYNKTNEKIVLEERKFHEQLNEVSSKKKQTLEKMEHFLELAKSFINLYDSANYEEKREYLNILTSNLALSGKKLSISIHSPFHDMLHREKLLLCAQTKTTHRTSKTIEFHPMTSQVAPKKMNKAQCRQLFEHILAKLPSLPNPKLSKTYVH